MQRNLRPALLAVLCVLAIALGAATLQSPVSPGSGGNPSFDGPGSGGGFDFGDRNRSGGSMGNLSGPPAQFSGLCVQFLLTDTFELLTLLTTAIAGALLYRRGGAVFAGAILTTFAAPFILVYFLLTDCGPEQPLSPQIPPVLSNMSQQNGSIVPGAPGSGSTPSIAPIEVVIFVLLVVVVGAAFLRATGDDIERDAESEPDEEAEPEPESESLAAVGAAAGEAADRIEENEGVENEVFRAWREMTDHLDVPNPESSTPAEFAAAAREAGMAVEDVDTLTDLFREIRYGGEEVTADREERAIAALRAVEDAYAEDDALAEDEP